MKIETETYGSCVVCGRPRSSGYDTCGASFCQEARHFNNVARNARKNSPAQHEAYARAKTATERALEVADRRNANEEASK
jgi:RNA polymerase-binding transcription factor DksA